MNRPYHHTNASARQASALHKTGIPLSHALGMSFAEAATALRELGETGPTRAWYEKHGGPHVFELSPELAAIVDPEPAKLETIVEASSRARAPLLDALSKLGNVTGLVVEHRGFEMRLYAGATGWAAAAEIATPLGDEPEITMEACASMPLAALDRLADALTEAERLGERPRTDDTGQVLLVLRTPPGPVLAAVFGSAFATTRRVTEYSDGRWVCHPASYDPASIGPEDVEQDNALWHLTAAESERIGAAADADEIDIDMSEGPVA